MSEDLKPCPFCGEAAGYETDDKTRINCANMTNCDFDGWAWAYTWNTRPIEDAQAQRIARLERVLAAVDARLWASGQLDAAAPAWWYHHEGDMSQIRRVIAAALR